uniref:U3-plectoxin-Pt1a n=1 Tax=Plectreurys tristis TaxID=33319 RepID=TXP10_PLETR|nr:RecName: Full=U3-plectoxin-Pt1a; Short=U3-PLTX-Pt1a; AltName: Full=Plectoxin X; Short=PLT-X; Short=PLTX; AltName: Full=Plectoxin-10 [Plectreurys tristis]
GCKGFLVKCDSNSECCKTAIVKGKKKQLSCLCGAWGAGCSCSFRCGNRC